MNHQEENLMLYRDRTIPTWREKRLQEEQEQTDELIRFALQAGNATEATRREYE